jgi:diguanylate cyclase (GGDEF)-like protein
MIRRNPDTPTPRTADAASAAPAGEGEREADASGDASADLRDDSKATREVDPVDTSADAEDEAFRLAARQSAVRGAVLQGGGLLIAVTATAIVVRGLTGGRSAQAAWAVQLLLGAATVAGICWGAWQRYKLWTVPVGRLSRIARLVRKGELPIEELTKVVGVPGVLVPVVRDLLLDLRRQRQAVQQLEQEMNQRVANRTDALERALGSLREKASRDAMTGLYNRRMLDETLPKVVAESATGRRPLTLLMVDVDYFKLLNDTLGHPAGDELLRAIGQIIRSTARASDLAFRAGGDEFVIVMPDADPAAGLALRDRLVSLVDGLAKTLRVEPRPRLSIGLAHLRDAADPTAEALLAVADKALYAVKGARKRSAVPSATAGADRR